MALDEEEKTRERLPKPSMTIGIPMSLKEEVTPPRHFSREDSEYEFWNNSGKKPPARNGRVVKKDRMKFIKSAIHRGSMTQWEPQMAPTPSRKKVKRSTFITNSDQEEEDESPAIKTGNEAGKKRSAPKRRSTSAPQQKAKKRKTIRDERPLGQAKRPRR